MDLMNRVFNDDILVYSQREAEHEQHLLLALQRSREHRLCAKFKKCEFWLPQATFLGLMVSLDENKVDLELIEAERDWPRPRSVSEIRSLLGLVEYYWGFVEGVSRISYP
ncbi:uncharacterized mitochondrial protein AtMg00860-like [Humulus lupulus]|uniref:uncharacterized mitochondrial protein AtMg00860-like n=1 Tax=Humulus lupulus TaxID=3486 RepID=UPI002B40E13D|nr:uncharacterized mitochondrial protein AtMg00860-like [Humulus lupulus]